MPTFRKILTSLVAACAITSLVNVPSYAATGADEASSPQAQQAAAARCRYNIVGSNVNVRSGPGKSHSVVRVKQNGERVTGPYPCAGTVYADGYYWVKLYLGTGGYGWTAEPYLHYTGYY